MWRKVTDAVKQRLGQLRTLLNILDQRREKADGEDTDLREKICAIELAIAHYEAALKIEGRIALLQEWEAAMLDTNWQELYETAILEIVPDKLAIRIVAAEQAIAQRESLVDTPELERHKLADARSMLKSLSRITLP